MNLSSVRALVLFVISVAIVLVTTSVCADTLFDNRLSRYKQKAAAGDKVAQYKLGMAYLLGKTGKVDVNKALTLFQASAKQGYSKAEFRLGYIYYNNKDGSRDYSKAYYWFSQAGGKNHSMSQYYAARILYEGRGVAKDYDKALYWVKKAKANGVHGAAQFMRKISAAIKAEKASKVAASKPKPVVRRRVKRYRSPRPKVTSPPRGDVAFDTRKVLMSGSWMVDGQPANNLPSQIVSECEQNSTRIKCTSDRIKTVTKNYIAHYKIIAIYSGFNSNGSFSVKYKQNYVFVLPEDPDEPNPKFDMPKMGLQDKTIHLDCRIRANNSIRCLDDKKNLVKFTK